MDKYARITYERPDGRLVGAQPTTEGQGQAVCGTAGRRFAASGCALAPFQVLTRFI